MTSPTPSSPSSPSPSSPSRSIENERFERVTADFDRLVLDVPSDRWGAPSPCAGWTARDVLLHVIDTEHELLVRMGFEAPDLDALEPLAAWTSIRTALSAAMADPTRFGHAYDGHFGPTTFGRTVDQFYSFDLVIHRWDIARATGLAAHEHIGDDLLAWLRTSAEGFGDALRMPGICGPAIDIDREAAPQQHLLAWLGRDPR